MKKTYSELLQDPRWQKKRLKLLEKNNWSCESCHTKDKTLQIHHTYYIKDGLPWEYPDESLKCLCQPCHLERQKLEKDIQKLLGKEDLWFLEGLVAWMVKHRPEICLLMEMLDGEFLEETKDLFSSTEFHQSLLRTSSDYVKSESGADDDSDYTTEFDPNHIDAAFIAAKDTFRYMCYEETGMVRRVNKLQTENAELRERTVKLRRKSKS